MTKFSDLTKALEAANEPKWHDFALDVALQIQRSGTPEYDRYFRKLLRTTRAARGQTPSDEEIETAEKKAMARHCLVGWRGIEDDDGKPIPYSERQALAYFDDPKTYDLYRFVRTVAQVEAVANLEAVEDDAGN